MLLLMNECNLVELLETNLCLMSQMLYACKGSVVCSPQPHPAITYLIIIIEVSIPGRL